MGTLYFGDNLDVLREHVADESVDLIYLDPPFNSARDYNVLFEEKDDSESDAQIRAFEDSWHWGADAEKAYRELTDQSGPASEKFVTLVEALRSFLGANDMMAYLTMMAVRLVELRRVLKNTGSLYLHCDPTASHYLKLLLDGIFGGRNFRGEIVWKRSSAHNDGKQGRRSYGRTHDTVFFYSKGEKWTWNPGHTDYEESYVGRDYKLVEEESGRRFRRGDLTAAKGGGDTEYEWRVKKHSGVRERWTADLGNEYRTPTEGWEYAGVKPYNGRYWAYSRDNLRRFAQEGRLRHTFDGMPEYKRYLDEMPGVSLQDIWTDLSPIVAGTAERLGYPTQKPLALLERIIATSSDKGDVVLDPFCGCGTAIHAAQRLDRKWIGIDVTHLAVALVRNRLDTAFPGISYDVQGEPADLAGARTLAASDPYQFQWWALHLIGARPAGESAGRVGKKGKDRGIDGVIRFRDDPDTEKSQRVIVSVKAGQHVNPGMVRDLAGTIEGEGAPIGVLFTMTEPTPEMRAAAAKAGKWRSATWNREYDRVQLITVEEAFAGKRPSYPGMDVTLRPAPTDANLNAPKTGTLPGIAGTTKPKGRRN